MADNLGGLIGAGLTLGIGLATLNALTNMNPQKKTEIENVLNQSKRFGTGFIIEIKEWNQNKVISILKKAGFNITHIEKAVLPKTLKIYFRERVR